MYFQRVKKNEKIMFRYAEGNPREVHKLKRYR